MNDNDKYLDKNSKKFIKIGLILIIAYFALYYIQSIFSFLTATYMVIRPILYGFIIAFIINMPMNFFEGKVFKRLIKNDKYKIIRSILSLIISWILVFGIFTLILTVMIPELVNAVTTLVNSLPLFVKSITDYLSQYSIFDQLVSYINENIANIDLNQISQSLTELFTGKDLGILNKTSTFLGSLSSGFIAITIGFFFSFYVSLNKEALKEKSHNIVYANFKKKNADRFIYLCKLTYDSFARFLETKLLSCLSIGIICFIGMKILGLPLAGMISILVGLFDIIPYFGPIIATGVGLILISIQSPVKAMIFLIYVLIIQQLQEKIIYPLFIGKRQGLPAIWIFVSVILGGRLFGIFGMIAFMPLATVAYTLTEDSTRVKLRKKNITKTDINEKIATPYEKMKDDIYDNY